MDSGASAAAHATRAIADLGHEIAQWSIGDRLGECQCAALRAVVDLDHVGACVARRGRGRRRRDAEEPRSRHELSQACRAFGRQPVEVDRDGLAEAREARETAFDRQRDAHDQVVLMPTPAHAAAIALRASVPKYWSALSTVRCANWRKVAVLRSRLSRSVSYHTRPAFSHAWPPRFIAAR